MFSSGIPNLDRRHINVSFYILGFQHNMDIMLISSLPYYNGFSENLSEFRWPLTFSGHKLFLDIEHTAVIVSLTAAHLRISIWIWLAGQWWNVQTSWNFEMSCFKFGMLGFWKCVNFSIWDFFSNCNNNNRVDSSSCKFAWLNNFSGFSRIWWVLSYVGWHLKCFNGMGFKKFTYSSHNWKSKKEFYFACPVCLRVWKRNVNISVYKLCKFPKSGCEVWQL